MVGPPSTRSLAHSLVEFREFQRKVVPLALRGIRTVLFEPLSELLVVDLVLLDPASEYGEVHVSYNVLSPPEYVQRRETEIQLWRAGWGRWFVQPITRLSVDGL